MQPPFIHNGFLADLMFVPAEKRKKKFEDDLGREDKKSVNGSNRKSNDSKIKDSWIIQDKLELWRK